MFQEECFELPLPFEGGDYVIVAYLYCDESGKVHNDKWISLCGYKIPAYRIHLFNERWGEWMEFWKTPPVHMAEIFHSYDRPKSAWHQVRLRHGDNWDRWIDQVLHRLASLIANKSEPNQASSPPISSFGAVLDASYFSTSCPKLKRRFDDDPIYFAFHRILLKHLEMTQLNTRDQDIQVVVDEDKDTAMQFHQVVSTIRHKSELGKRIRSLCFVDDKTYPLIQAADMLAYAARQRKLDLSGSPIVPLPQSIYGLLTASGSEPEVLDAESLRQLEEGQ